MPVEAPNRVVGMGSLVDAACAVCDWPNHTLWTSPMAAKQGKSCGERKHETTSETRRELNGVATGLCPTSRCSRPQKRARALHAERMMGLDRSTLTFSSVSLFFCPSFRHTFFFFCLSLVLDLWSRSLCSQKKRLPSAPLSLFVVRETEPKEKKTEDVQGKERRKACGLPRRFRRVFMG